MGAVWVLYVVVKNEKVAFLRAVLGGREMPVVLVLLRGRAPRRRW